MQNRKGRPDEDHSARVLFYVACLVIFLMLCACATKPPNVPICVEINMTKGRCVKIISGDEITIDETHPYAWDGVKKNEKTWWQLRPAMVLVPAPSWAEIKAFIIKICNSSGQCEQEVGKWERSVEYIDSQLESKTN